MKIPLDHARRGLRYTNSNELACICVPASTLCSMLAKANAPKVIDLLSLDVEGGELEVLKGIDFDEYKFRLMVIETRIIGKVASYLAGYGYLWSDSEGLDHFSSHENQFEFSRLLDPASENSLRRIQAFRINTNFRSSFTCALSRIPLE